MSNTFPLIEPTPKVKLQNTLETIKSVSYIFCIAGLYMAYRYYIKSIIWHSTAMYYVSYFILLLTLGFTFILVYNYVKPFFKPQDTSINIIGTVSFEDDQLIINYHIEAPIKLYYYEIDRIDIYYYQGIKPTVSRRQNAYIDMDVYHIRLYEQDVFTHLYVQNTDINSKSLGVLYNRLVELQGSTNHLFKAIQFWAEFEEDD
ncbi:MAG: hypothetical protein WCP57_12740 [Bacteroidota bacterium]